MMRLKPAKSVPEFRTIEEEAQWWDTHDTSELWKNAKPVRPIRLPPDQVKFIHERAAARKQAISIRLDKEQIEAAKRIAARKSIGYQTQLRMWIAEGLSRDA
jgi:predicted DNA binding CopG/RHH family protein